MAMLTPALLMLSPIANPAWGYVFLTKNGAVSWRATRTPLVTLNAAESEVIALSAVTQEANAV
jgi:hypothetical protein